MPKVKNSSKPIAVPKSPAQRLTRARARQNDTAQAKGDIAASACTENNANRLPAAKTRKKKLADNLVGGLKNAASLPNDAQPRMSVPSDDTDAEALTIDLDAKSVKRKPLAGRKRNAVKFEVQEEAKGTQVKNRSKRKVATKAKSKTGKAEKNVEETKPDLKELSQPTSRKMRKRKTNSAVEEDGESSRIELESKMHLSPRKSPRYSARASKFLGAHTSIQGGLFNAVNNAVAIGAKAFALFLRSQRQWVTKPMDESAAERFRSACERYEYKPHLILPHGSYLLNCGAPNPETLRKSRETLVDELQRCEQLGLTMFNFHPGSTCGEISVDECLDRIGESINMAHGKTKYCMTVIENMCCQGNTVGGRFEELRDIISRVNDKSRIGVCLDTCHAFAAGHNIAKKDGYEQMMSDFDKIVGLKYLKAVHLNDSKGKVGCHLDRHENIGNGHIGLDGFSFLMNDPRFDNIPLILETPANLSDEDEIHILYALCDS